MWHLKTCRVQNSGHRQFLAMSYKLSTSCKLFKRTDQLNLIKSLIKFVCHKFGSSFI